MIDARECHRLLAELGATVATAESLTGGLLGAALTEWSGSSRIYRGGVVVYATDLKHTLLGVPDDLLARLGPVDAETAIAMADGVRDRLGATYGLATTGVAGPDPLGDQPVGTVHVACAGPRHTQARGFGFDGGRSAIREASVRAALELLQDVLEARRAEDRPGRSGT
ncbi:MAG TPA: CinA family protein [Actinopolymorphaceae bacterium]